MKKTKNILVALAVAILAAACQTVEPIVIPETENKPSTETEMVEVILTTAPVTRTSMADNGDILWSSTDSIAVVYNGTVYPFELFDGAGTTSAKFKGTVPASDVAMGPVAAYYPYVQGMTFANDLFSGFSIPTSQAYTAESFATDALPMSGAISNGIITFTAVAAIAKVNVTMESIECAELTLGNNTYALTFDGLDASNGVNLIFVVDPGEYTSASIKFSDSFSAALTPKSILAGKRYVLGGVAPVVQACGKYYASLAEAIAAVPTDGTKTTVTMLENETIAQGSSHYGVATLSGQNIVLDLAGKTISGTDAKGGTYELIYNLADLEIMDSVGGGKISYASTTPDGSWGYGTNTILNYKGTLTLTSGRIENLTNGGASYAIDNSTNQFDATFIMNGGTVACPNGDQAVRLYCNSDTRVNTVTINGGEIETGGVWLQMPSGTADRIGHLTITGGTINGMLDFMSNDPTHAYANITGGVFDADKFRIRNGASSTPFVNISGGSFKTNVLDNQETDIKGVALTGGLFNDQTFAETFAANGYGAAPSGNATYPYMVIPANQAVTTSLGDWL